ncbi:MAG: hypothetical protein DCO99_03610 [Synechococcus sp. XM-24]|nr:MAG: hypothetical protein DCO99_03610 [Synechococcus sp. XM-24]
MAYAVFDHTRLRKGHNDMINGALGLNQLETFVQTGGRQGKQGISSMQPTRSGKGVQMRHIGVCAVTGWVDKDGQQHDPIASLVVMVSPTSVLAAQVVDQEKYRETFKMLRLDSQLFRDCPVQKVGPELDRNFRKEERTFQLLDDYGRIKTISCTNDFLLSRLDHIKRLCQERLKETGLPVLFLLDEVQRLGDKTQAYGAVQMLSESAGVLSVSFTATPARADGGGIWNFGETVKSLKTSTIKQFKGINKEDPKLVDYDVLDKQSTELVLHGDVEVGWDYAWNNDYLCRINVDLIDVKAQCAIEEIEDDEEAELWESALESFRLKPGQKGVEGEVMLSSFYNPETCEIKNKALTRKIIQLASRQEETIRQGVRKMLARLKSRRAAHPETKGLVFGGNDLPDGSDNAHLEQAKRIMASEWNRFFPGRSFRPMILTMKDESLKSSDDAITRLKEFEEEPYDVIFLKQMAAEGWDTKKTKVGLMLSPIRTYSFMIQASFRVATPWETEEGQTVLTADLIALKDPFFLMFRDWVHDTQGPISKRTTTSKIDELTKERQHGPKRAQTVEILESAYAGSAAFGSSDQLNVDEGEIVARIRDRHPAVNGCGMTDAILWQLYCGGAFSDCAPGASPSDPEKSESDPFRDEGIAKRELIAQVQERLKQCVKRACGKLNVKLNGEFGLAVSTLAGKAADHHNARHPKDGVLPQFSQIRSPEIAQRFYTTVMADYWEKAAIEIVRKINDRNQVEALF